MIDRKQIEQQLQKSGLICNSRLIDIVEKMLNDKETEIANLKAKVLKQRDNADTAFLAGLKEGRAQLKK